MRIRGFKLHEKFHLLSDFGRPLTGNNRAALKLIPVSSECHFLQFVFVNKLDTPLLWSFLISSFSFSTALFSCLTYFPLLIDCFTLQEYDHSLKALINNQSKNLS